MTDHVHEWGIRYEVPCIRCKNIPCDATLPEEQAEAMLNAAEQIANEIDYHIKHTRKFDQITLDVAVFEHWRAKARGGDNAPNPKPEHWCGRQGFGLHWSDSCPACEARGGE